MSIKDYVFPLVMTYGIKPANLDFLNDIVDELERLLENGIRVGSKLYKFRLKCITCDAPAKSFVRGSKQFTSTHGCDKCLILGKNIKGSNCYLETSFTKRTDIDFRNKTYALHHNYDTPLSRL